MAAGYTKEFLVSAFLSRYISLPEDVFEKQTELALSFYDEVGRDKFRVYCSLDAAAIKEYKNSHLI